MPIKVTKKDIESTFPFIISIPYGDLQNLLYYRTPVMATYGTYGQNSRIYILCDNTVVVTGNRTFGYRPSNDVIRWYEDKAKSILQDRDIKDTRKCLDDLINQFGMDMREQIISNRLNK